MSIENQVIKLLLFGNVWVVRFIKLLHYVSIFGVGWLISKYNYLFAVSPWATLQMVWQWENQTIEIFLMAFFTLFYAALLLFVYYLISDWLVKKLVRISLSPANLKQVLTQKVYSPDEKTNYSVEGFDNLKITVTSNKYTYKGVLNLSKTDKKQKKQVNFVCRSSVNLENDLIANFPVANFQVKSKSLLNWKNLVLLVLCAGSVGYFYLTYQNIKSLPGEVTIEQAIKSKAEIQKNLAKKEEKEKKQSEKEEKYRRAKVTHWKDIKVTFDSIGGLREVKENCKINAEAILRRNKYPDDWTIKPGHMILYGPPGTGKTMLAWAMARHSESFFLNLNGSDFSMSVAQVFGNEKGLNTEEKLRVTFDIALQVADEAGIKTIIALIDEIDHMSDSWKGIGKELQTVLDNPRYKDRIVIIATTNFLWKMSDAVLRPGRLSDYQLVNYPDENDLLPVIKKVLGQYYDYMKKESPKGLIKITDNSDREPFINKFADKIHEEMKKSKYIIKYGDLVEDPEDLPSNFKPDDGRILFTGSDVWKVAFEAVTRAASRKGREKLTFEDFATAINVVYQGNRKRGDWLSTAERFLFGEVSSSKDQDFNRKKRKKNRGPGPQM